MEIHTHTLQFLTNLKRSVKLVITNFCNETTKEV